MTYSFDGYYSIFNLISSPTAEGPTQFDALPMLISLPLFLRFSANSALRDRNQILFSLSAAMKRFLRVPTLVGKLGKYKTVVLEGKRGEGIIAREPS